MDQLGGRDPSPPLGMQVDSISRTPMPLESQVRRFVCRIFRYLNKLDSLCYILLLKHFLLSHKCLCHDNLVL